MKKYYGYSESSNKSNWKYFNGKFKYPSFEEIQNNEYVDTGGIHIRYVSYCNKKDMIGIIGELINNKNWVRQRIADTGNKKDIELAQKYPGKIIVYIDEGSLKNTVISLIDINSKNIKKVK